MRSAEVASLARAAGLQGRFFDEWAEDEAIQEHMFEADASEIDTGAWEDAHRAGQSLWRESGGWIVRWTTAEPAYDSFGTSTAEECGKWRDKLLRRVVINPIHLGYQEARYGSGLHGSWAEDPREQERRIAESVERERFQREDRDRRHACGLARLREMSLDEVEATCESDTLSEDLGVSYDDAREERRRRRAQVAETERLSEINLAREELNRRIGSAGRLVDGGTSTVYDLIDLGFPRTAHSQGRAPSVHYAVHERSFTERASAFEIEMVDSTGDVVWSLEYLARLVREGRVCAATSADDLPPEPVYDRFGRPAPRTIVYSIRRVEVDGRTLWVGYQPHVYDNPLVLDERGHKVRSQKLRGAAIRAYHATEVA